MYIEYKGEGIVGPAKIGKVTFSKSGRRLYYQGKQFQSLKVKGFKSNYYDIETGEEYWISGCRKDGRDALYNTQVVIDEDIREEYWKEIRKMPENIGIKSFWAQGKCK